MLAGSKAYPTAPTLQVVVTAGKSTQATVNYGTIVSSLVTTLTSVVQAEEGDPTDPASITVTNSQPHRVGEILVQTSSATLPAGLFHKVTAVRTSGNQVTLTLKPAQLDSAFPAVDFTSHLNLAGNSSASTSSVRAMAAPLAPVTVAVNIKNYSCQTPIADSTLSFTQSLTVGADVAMTVPRKFDIPVGLPTGRVSMTLGASAQLAAFLRANLGCSLNVKLPAIPAEIPIGPVLVPVFLQVGAGGSLTIADGDFKGNASAGFSATAGITFKGTKVTNISSLQGTASLTASGGGKLSAGPAFKFAVGVSDAADVHLDVNPALAFTATTSGCELDAVLGSDVGVSFGPVDINQPLPDLTRKLASCPATPPPPATTSLSIQHTGPLGVFPNQVFPYTVRVTNTGANKATAVTLSEVLPSSGSFVSSSPGGTPAAPAPGSTYSINVGDLAAGQSVVATVSWRAPAQESSLTAIASAQAANAPLAGPATASVPVGTALACNPCGETAAGTGLRNRDHGSVTISGVPAGATVGRAVLVWAELYNGTQPPNTITFGGHAVSADVTSTVSGNLCWGDTSTVGYAADVTSYVTGNGTFDITDPPHGVTQPDNNPAGVLPYTDGASLLVFYNGGGANNQVLSDFTYDTDTDADGVIHRSFTGVHSLGHASTLTLAGPDGQTSGGESFTLTGSGSIALTNTWDGSDPQDGPSFAIGNLWDTDVYDVSTILPSGQDQLTFDHAHSQDCIGVGAAVLQTAQ